MSKQSNLVNNSQDVTVDASGNVGIGCVPNSIQSGFDTLQIGGNLTLNVDSTGAGAGVYMGNNVYRDSTNSRWEYINTDEASQYYQANGTHVWRYAASGSANAAITWSESMRINSSGAVTMPSQPSFSATNNTASQTNLAINAYHTVVFGTEIFDQGSDFASNTFTAPVTGRYQFNVHLRLHQIDTAASYYQAYITTSNRDYEVGLITPVFTSDPTYLTLSSSFLVDMDAADTAFVRFYQAGGSAQTDLQQGTSIFSGYLVA